MTRQSQDDVVAFLQAWASAGAGGAPVQRIDTHLSTLLLAGDRAYKLKRAVRLPYVDFSTPERREAACQDELRLNRRTAPSIYLGVRRLTKEPGGLAIDGSGPLVDAIVEMKRFDQEALFDVLADRAALTPAHIDKLAAHIAVFHRQAAVAPKGGGAARVAHVLDINVRAFATTHLFDADAVAALGRDLESALARHAPLLDRRAREGMVRRCHGDLHLGNICLIGDEPVMFDCLEFDEELATTDTLYDLAFVLMDLWRRDLRALANRLLNAYFDECDEPAGLALLPLFMAMRAAVRAHVGATQAESAAPGVALEDIDRKRRTARAYFDLARSLLKTAPPRLLAIGGLSGSGKSTLARALAPEIGPPPGARIASSDKIRKRIFGVPPTERLPAEAYAAAVSARVYDIQRQVCAATMEAGHATVADAVFDRADERARIEDVARKGNAPFSGLWLEGSAESLARRIGARKGDVSDATVEILNAQLKHDIGVLTWTRIDTGHDPEHMARRAVEALKTADV